MSSPLRTLYGWARSLDRRNPWWALWLPSRWKRRVLRTVVGWLDRGAKDDRPVRIDGFDVAVPLAQRGTYVHQDHEPEVRWLLRELLRPGMVCVDVGANIGLHALTASRRVGPQGRVVAVEPSDDNLAYLRRNLGLNGATNVEVVAAAAGPVRQRRVLHLRGDSGHHGFFPHPRQRTVRRLEVEQVPLDELVAGRVDVVKIDVEAAELDVLAGMERLLDENAGIALLVEWSPTLLRAAGQPLDALPGYLRGHGFEVHRLEAAAGGGGRLLPFDAAAPLAEGDHNLLAVRRLPAALGGAG